MKKMTKALLSFLLCTGAAPQSFKTADANEIALYHQQNEFWNAIKS